MSEKVLNILIYIVIGFIVYRIICSIINKINLKTERRKGLNIVYKKRQGTVLNLIKNIFKYLIVVIIILLILNTLGVNTTSILASIGVAGVIVGLAFQDTVKNLLAGVSIIFDNHYMQGDYVTINDFEGEVIQLGLQATKIKSYTGEVLVIDNSQITQVINHSMYDSRLIIQFPIKNDVDLDKLDKIINNIDKRIIEMKEVKNNIEIKGVESFDAENLIYRIEVVCAPYSYFSVKREFYKLLKLEFEKNNLNISPERIDINLKK